ncbi:MAG TPA: undecaprenyldiphospho-muramoylpentapeptide beta-N-acetylglucosaminyltransferase [Alphaproteobacteria bacterium]|nr:undecaprenyldiphospho-muramoylpentapeptide beta-N-acetylglucosaminyltransferase [Alphaproteobacteria bacterium]
MTAPGKILVLLTAGGTGGHMFPADALARALLDRGCEVALVTDKRGGAYGDTLSTIATHKIRAGQVTGRGPVAKLLGLADVALGTLQARGLLKRLRPAAVVGFGGYASFPAMMAAGWLGIPSALHEQNAVLGRANRFLAKRATRIAVAYAKVRGLPPGGEAKLHLTGNPVRAPIAALAKADYSEPAADKLLNILVLGGSQGARIFSEVVPAAIAVLPETARKRLSITQQARQEDLAEAEAAYAAIGLKAELRSFFDDVPERLKAAHLLICRAGASTIAELTTAGRPAVLVPYPYATDDHQTANAASIDAAGGGWLVPQPEFKPESLAARLAGLLDDPSLLADTAKKAKTLGHPDAAQRLAGMVLDMLPASAAANAGAA